MLVVIETHPIQYHAPVYREVQQTYGIPTTVIYGSDFSIAGYRDEEFGASFSWDSDLLSGYSSVFLSRVGSGGARSTDQVSAAGVGDLLESLDPAAIMTVGYSPRFHRDAWLTAWRTGRPLLFRGETNDQARARSWWKHMGRDVALRMAYRTCSRLLYVGAQSRRHFERLGVSSDRLVFSPYCVDIRQFETGDLSRRRLRQATRHMLQIEEDAQVLLFSGKLSSRKGVDLLIEAVKRLPRDVRQPTVTLFVGDGALRDDLAARAEESPAVHAVFAGFQNQSQLSSYYHAADLLVLPSRSSETWGLVVNEALHHGVPCVVSDRVGCAEDLIASGLTGEIFAADSVTALGDAIQAARSLCGRDDVRQACMARAGAYSTQRAAAGIAEAYDALTRTGRAA